MSAWLKYSHFFGFVNLLGLFYAEFFKRVDNVFISDLVRTSFPRQRRPVADSNNLRPVWIPTQRRKRSTMAAMDPKSSIAKQDDHTLSGANAFMTYLVDGPSFSLTTRPSDTTYCRAVLNV